MGCMFGEGPFLVNFVQGLGCILGGPNKPQTILGELCWDCTNGGRERFGEANFINWGGLLT